MQFITFHDKPFCLLFVTDVILSKHIERNNYFFLSNLEEGGYQNIKMLKKWLNRYILLMVQIAL